MSNFGERLKETAKMLAPIGLAASFIFPPAAAITIPLTTAATIGGAATAGYGYATNNDKVKKAGLDVLEVAMTAVTNDPTGKSSDHFNKTVGLGKKK